MKKILMLLMFGMFLISLFLISLVSADCSIPSSKLGDTIELTQTCANCSYVNLTKVVYPNQTIDLLGQYSMQENGTNYNYSYITNTVGNYYYTTQGDLNGITTTQTCSFVVTSSGKEINSGNSLMIFLGTGFFLILGILCFVAFFRSNGNIGISLPVRWTFFIFGFIFFLASINLISATIPDSLINENVLDFFDSFTAISTYLFWFSFGILGVMWIITTFQTILFKNKMKKEESYA
jgi:hypothetical protein